MNRISARRDLDSTLLTIDWTQNDWRTYDWTSIAHLLRNLRDETVNAIAQEHLRTKTDDFSPIHLEQLRRMRVRGEGDSGTPSGKPIYQYFVTPNAIDLPDTFTEDYGPQSLHGEFEGNKIHTWTSSIIMEVAIAATLASGVNYDPHPADTRPLLVDTMDRDKYDADLHEYIKSEVVRAINISGVRVIAKRPDETSVGFQADVKRALILEYGFDPEDRIPSPVRPRTQKANEDVAQAYYAASLRTGTNLRLYAYTWDHLLARCAEVKADVVSKGTFNARDVQQICERHDDLLKLAWFRAKRDVFHIFVPGMRPRYRGFSVGHWPKVITNATQVPWYYVSRASYSHRPTGEDGTIPFPEEHYKWFYGRIYTPVVPINSISSIRLRHSLEWVTTGLRRKFRIHRDMPSLELGTIVNISHTLGYTIIELKKIVTLWVAVEGVMAKLHRRHRYDRNNIGEHAIWTGGASILQYTVLGAACRFAEDPGRNSYYPYMAIFPSVTQRTWNHVIEGEMVYWVSPAWFKELPRADQLFVHAIWAYTSIDQITAALQPRWPNVKTSIRLRCSGTRRTGAPEDNFPQTVEFAGMQQSLDPDHLNFWTVICASFCSFCSQSTNRYSYSSLFVNRDAILEKIGVPQEARDYFAKFFAQGNEFYEPPDAEVDWDDPFYPKPPPDPIWGV